MWNTGGAELRAVIAGPAKRCAPARTSLLVQQTVSREKTSRWRRRLGITYRSSNVWSMPCTPPLALFPWAPIVSKYRAINSRRRRELFEDRARPCKNLFRWWMDRFSQLFGKTDESESMKVTIFVDLDDFWRTDRNLETMQKYFDFQILKFGCYSDTR